MAYDPTAARWREHHITPRYLAGTTGTGDPAPRQPLARQRPGLGL